MSSREKGDEKRALKFMVSPQEGYSGLPTIKGFFYQRFQHQSPEPPKIFKDTFHQYLQLWVQTQIPRMLSMIKEISIQQLRFKVLFRACLIKEWFCGIVSAY